MIGTAAGWAALTLSASLSLAQSAPGSPAKELGDLRGSMEHWVLMARPDAADPEARQLAQQLTALHTRAVKTQPAEADAIVTLQRDFSDWKDRFAKLCFDRRPAAAPNDYAVYRKQLETGIGGLAQLHLEAAGATQHVAALKRLVDPMSFQWYVEGSKDHSGVGGIPGWLQAKADRGPASAGLPAGWTQAAPDKPSDLQTDAPPDPTVVKGVERLGERKWKYGGTVGQCYAGVKTLLEKLNVVSSFEGRRGRDGEGRAVKTNELTGAYQFDRWVENHPTLQKRRLFRKPLPAWPLEISDVVVWGRGVCGYNDDWGHIEMIYKLSADKRRAWAVSDHSQEFNVACFEREAAKANEARHALPGLRQAVADAQAQSPAQTKSKDRRAALKARRDLAAKRAALSKAEQAADSVSVYKIGSESRPPVTK